MRSVDALSGLLKIFLSRFWYVHKLLWVAVSHRKPGTLNLKHDFVTASKRVVDIRQAVFNFCWLAGRHWFRSLKTVSELGSKWLSSHQLLIAPHLYPVGRDRMP